MQPVIQKRSLTQRTAALILSGAVPVALGCSHGASPRDTPALSHSVTLGSASSTSTTAASEQPAADAGQAGGAGNSEPFAAESRVTVVVSGETPKAVAATFFGQNYWSWVPEWGDPVAQVVAQVNNLHLGLLRAGGANNDVQDPAPFTSSEIAGFLDFSESVGAQPLLQVPVLSNGSGAAMTAADAAALVAAVNQGVSTRVKYFSIGNEPDLYADQGHQAADYDAGAFCETYAAFAAAMREQDPNIQLLGPDLSWKYQTGSNDWLTPFLDQCGASVDVVAVHRYPFAPDACDETGAFSDGVAFRDTITHVRAIMDATGNGDKPLAFTEANITYDGSPELSVEAASPGTFLAALWLADSLGVALEEQIFSVNYWSLSEGWTLGFFDVATPRPAYHVMRLFAQNFGDEVQRVTQVPDGLRVYAGHDSEAGSTSIIAINQRDTDLNLDVTFEQAARSLPLALPLRARSLLVARVPDADMEPVLYPYTEHMATAGIAP